MMAGPCKKNAPKSAASQGVIWPLHHGRRSAGGQKKRYKDQLKAALRKCRIRPEALEDAAADRNTWRQQCLDGTRMMKDRTARRQEKETQEEHTCRLCCHYHNLYMSYLQQDVWIQDRTTQPSKDSPLEVDVIIGLRWTTEKRDVDSQPRPIVCIVKDEEYL